MVTSFRTFLYAHFRFRLLQLNILSKWEKKVQSLGKLICLVISGLVAQEFNSRAREIPYSVILEDTYNGCQPDRLRRSPRRLLSAGDFQVIWLSLNHWTSWLQGHPIWILSDSTTTIAYGKRSRGNSILGRKSCSSAVHHLDSRQLVSRLSQTAMLRLMRMVF